MAETVICLDRDGEHSFYFDPKYTSAKLINHHRHRRASHHEFDHKFHRICWSRYPHRDQGRNLRPWWKVALFFGKECVPIIQNLNLNGTIGFDFTISAVDIQLIGWIFAAVTMMKRIQVNFGLTTSILNGSEIRCYISINVQHSFDSAYMAHLNWIHWYFLLSFLSTVLSKTFFNERLPFHFPDYHF